MQEISNNQLTLLRKLNQKKYREQKELFSIEGDRAVEQVLKNSLIKVKRLYFDSASQYWEKEHWNRLSKNVEAVQISRNSFLQITDTEHPQGVLALCEIPGETPVETMTKGEGIIIGTDRIQDPGNMGTIIRTAGWFGVEGMLSGKGSADLFHPKVVRSTAGATGSVPYRNSVLAKDLERFETEGWQVFLLDGGKDSSNLETLDIPLKSVLIVGNEAQGIDPELYSDSRTKIKIKSNTGNRYVESLNAAIALSIALYAFSA